MSDGYRFTPDLQPAGQPNLPFTLPSPDRPCRVLIDTDTAAEVDDQFALTYALLSPDRIELEAVTAAPFIAPRRGIDSPNAVDYSHAEILAVYAALGLGNDQRPATAKGSRQWIREADGPVRSDAVDLIIERARAEETDGPLYILAIAAPTNVTSALQLAPDIRSRVVVCWLGGQPTNYPTAWEYNGKHDPPATRGLFRSGVPLMMIPGKNVSELLRVTVPEMDAYVRPHGEIGRFLAGRVAAYHPEHRHRGWSKILWDLANVGWIIQPEWVPTVCRDRVVADDAFKWQACSGPPMLEAVDLYRDRILTDFYAKLERYAQQRAAPAADADRRATPSAAVS
ncbi:MAG: nucleoside hydrolase [Planctomycetota bacterium]